MIEWKTIERFPEYMISSDGEVKSIKTDKILKTFLNNKNYLTIRIYKDKKGYTQRIHRLVAEAFIPNPDNKPEVDHINTNKFDNNFKNLRWVTSKENSSNLLTRTHMCVSHSKAGTHIKSKSISIKNIITDEIYSYDCIRYAAEELDIKYSTLRSALRKKSIINKKYKII